MGSGGSLTLWSPSNEAGATAGFLIDVCIRANLAAYRPPTALRVFPLCDCVARVSRPVIDGGITKHEQSY
jgi:hypothetical protein